MKKRFLCEGTITILDVVEAEDEEQALVIFSANYPESRSHKITAKEMEIKNENRNS